MDIGGNQFPIFSIKNLSYILGYKKKIPVLLAIADSANDYYRPFTKLKPKHRQIDNPIGELKTIQKRIDKRIFKNIQLPDGMVGGVKGKSIKNNAGFHINKKVVVTIDIKKCFPSTHHTQVFNMFRKELGYGDKVASLMTKLTTYNGYVPQGSPCSSSLINLCLLPLYRDLETLTKKNNLTLSQWVDDITVSGDNPDSYLPEIIKLVQKHGYSCRAKKIKVMRSNKRQEVTGLMVNKKISITNRIDTLRKLILNTNNLDKSTIEHQKEVIKGKMQFIKSIDEKKYLKLQKLAIKILEKDY